MAQLAQPLSEGIDEVSLQTGRGCAKEADAGDLSSLLRACCARPRN
jgi:hypothetical protein